MGCQLRHNLSHLLHGAGIFTYKTGWFWANVGIHIPAPWFASGFWGHHGGMFKNPPWSQGRKTLTRKKKCPGLQDSMNSMSPLLLSSQTPISERTILVGGWALHPLNNMSSSVGIIIPIYYGNRKKYSKPPTIYIYIYILLSIDIPIYFSFLASQTAKGLCQNMDGLPLPTCPSWEGLSWRNSWLHHGSPRGYPPVVKHGNRRLSIHRWYSHSHLHLLGGFPLPRLSTARSVYFQTSPSRLRTIFSHIPRAPRASESHGRHSQSQATLTRKWMQYDAISTNHGKWVATIKRGNYDPLWIQTLSEKVLNPPNYTPNTS